MRAQALADHDAATKEELSLMAYEVIIENKVYRM
jgi:hypothetical protein